METERFSLRDLPKLLSVFLGVLLGLYETQQDMTKNSSGLEITKKVNQEEMDQKVIEIIRRIVDEGRRGSSPAAPQLPQDGSQPKADEIGGEP